MENTPWRSPGTMVKCVERQVPWLLQNSPQSPLMVPVLWQNKKDQTFQKQCRKEWKGLAGRDNWGPGLETQQNPCSHLPVWVLPAQAPLSRKRGEPFLWCLPELPTYKVVNIQAWGLLYWTWRGLIMCNWVFVQQSWSTFLKTFAECLLLFGVLTMLYL